MQKASFGVRLRIPAWCKSPTVRINGVEASPSVRDGWAELVRTWGPADVVELILPQEIKVTVDKQGQAVVERGPLLYALPVRGEHRQTDEWGSFEELVTPESKWNYALVLSRDNPSSTLNFRKLEGVAGGSVWEHPPFGIEVDAERLPSRDDRCGGPPHPDYQPLRVRPGTGSESAAKLRWFWKGSSLPPRH
jgi:uncharacterized protein